MDTLLVRLLYYFLIAFAIGTLAQLLTGYHKRRVFTTLIIGFVGVIAGDYIARFLHLPHIIPPYFGVSLIWAVVGSVLFVFLFRVIRGRW